MRKIVVVAMISIDGVMQAPGGPEEDPSGGFEYGGWTAPYGDQIGLQILKKQMQPADYLLGRKTFENFASFWPHHTDFWPAITEGTKYVLSNSITQSDWNNTTFVKNLTEIKALKQSDGADIQVWGSSELIHLLLENDMIDELWLRIYPVCLGEGKKLFYASAVPSAFKLTETLATSTGVIIANYSKSGKVESGTIEA